MKKLLMLILSLSMATVAFTSCNFNELFQDASDSISSAPTSSVEEPVESVEPEKNEYTVTFQQAGQEDVVVTVEEGAAVAEADIPTPVQEEGYTIAWKADDLAQLANVTGNITVTTEKTANTYTITFEVGEDIVFPATKTVTYDAEVTLSAPERAGYTFAGWYIKDTDTQVVSGAWKIANDVTLTAAWTENAKATITFVYADGSSDASTQVYVNTALTDIPNPQAVAKVGYTVDTNWYTDSACTTVANFTNITENMTVYAKATANTYTITYNANGGTVANATQSVVYDSNVTLAVPTRDNYIFHNWKDSAGNIVTNGKWTIANNVTLTADWTEMGKATITFVYADGSTDSSTQVYIGGSLTGAQILDPTSKAVTGYTIDANWYTDNTYATVASFDNITASMTVYAKKTVKNYTVQLNANGGTGVAASFNVNYNETITLDVPSKAGYNFLGWYDGESFVAKDSEIKWTYDNSNMTLTAKWEAKTYKVTLDPNGGSVSVTTMEIKYGESYTLPTPTNGDATFAGWKQNGTTIPVTGTWTYTAAGENVKLVATWQESDWTQNY